jgi:hypothetical protein
MKLLTYLLLYIFLLLYVLGIYLKITHDEWAPTVLLAAIGIFYGLFVPALVGYGLLSTGLKPYLNHYNVLLLVLPGLFIGSLVGLIKLVYQWIGQQVMPDIYFYGISPNIVVIISWFMALMGFSYLQAKGFEVYERLFYGIIMLAVMSLVLDFYHDDNARWAYIASFGLLILVYIPLVLWKHFQRHVRTPDIIDEFNQP